MFNPNKKAAVGTCKFVGKGLVLTVTVSVNHSVGVVVGAIRGAVIVEKRLFRDSGPAACVFPGIPLAIVFAIEGGVTGLWTGCFGSPDHPGAVDYRWGESMRDRV